MKNFLYIFLGYISYISVFQSFALTQEELKDSIIPPTGNGIISTTTDSESGIGFLDAILAFVRDSVFAVLVIIAIGMFLFIGAKLVVARWNPEEFKKALQSFIYAAIGILVVAFAYAAVTIVAGLNI